MHQALLHRDMKITFFLPRLHHRMCSTTTATGTPTGHGERHAPRGEQPRTAPLSFLLGGSRWRRGEGHFRQPSRNRPRLRRCLGAPPVVPRETLPAAPRDPPSVAPAPRAPVAAAGNTSGSPSRSASGCAGATGAGCAAGKHFRQPSRSASGCAGASGAGCAAGNTSGSPSRSASGCAGTTSAAALK